MNTNIFRWNGVYFGFIKNDYFFDKQSNYLGWIEGNEVRLKDGAYFGDISNTNYILRKTSMSAKSKKSAKSAPSRPSPPSIPSNKIANSSRLGFIDALSKF